MGNLSRWLTVERALYGACLAAAASLRFRDLEAHALSFGEAVNAWPAWISAVTGESGGPAPGAPPTSALLFSLHWLLFWLAGGASDPMVRWPGAAIGTALVLLPWALRPVVGRSAALILAGILAIDPLLVGASRTADGAILSAFCAVLVAVVCFARVGPGAPTDAAGPRPRRGPAAIAIGLLLVSGTLAWGFLGLLATAALGWRGYRLASQPPTVAVTAVLVSGIVAATTGLAQWEGPPAVSASLTAWIGAWTGRLDLGTAVRGLLRTQPLLVALPLVGLVSASKGPRSAAGRRWALGLVVIALATLLACGQGGAAARLPLALVLALAAALAVGPLAEQVAAWWRGGARRPRALACIWVAAVGLLALVTMRAAVAAADRPTATGPRLLARDLATLCAWRTAPRSCRIDVVAAPRPDPVLAWYLRNLSGVRWILSPGADAGDGDPPLVITPADRGAADGAASLWWPLPYVGSEYPADASPGGRVVLWVPREP